MSQVYGGGYNGAKGVDIGSDKLVMACFDQKGITIIPSDTSDKQTPTIVAFTEQERVVGLAAAHQRKRNLKNTFKYFSRFMGLTADCTEQIELEKKFIIFDVDTNKDDKSITFPMTIEGIK